MAEEWKPVPGFKGYEISNKGRVRSFWTRSEDKGGFVDPRREPRILKPSKDRGGCVLVTLYRYEKGEKSKRNTAVARMVLTVFVRPANDGEIVRYKDESHDNCAKTNLAWSTRAAEARRILGAAMPAAAAPRIGKHQPPRKAPRVVAGKPEYKRKKGGNPQKGKRVPSIAA